MSGCEITMVNGKTYQSPLTAQQVVDGIQRVQNPDFATPGVVKIPGNFSTVYVDAPKGRIHLMSINICSIEDV